MSCNEPWRPSLLPNSWNASFKCCRTTDGSLNPAFLPPDILHYIHYHLGEENKPPPSAKQRYAKRHRFLMECRGNRRVAPASAAPYCRNKHFYSGTDSKKKERISDNDTIQQWALSEAEQANGLICCANKRGKKKKSVKALQPRDSVALSTAQRSERSARSCLSDCDVWFSGWRIKRARQRKMSSENQNNGRRNMNLSLMGFTKCRKQKAGAVWVFYEFALVSAQVWTEGFA